MDDATHEIETPAFPGVYRLYAEDELKKKLDEATGNKTLVTVCGHLAKTIQCSLLHVSSVRRAAEYEKATYSESWTAWVDLMRPGLKSLRVKGIVEAPHPGYTASLEVATPQGINPTELLFEVRLDELPGDVWATVMSPIPVIYEDLKYQGDHKTVLIRLPDGSSVQRKIREIR
jgi:hypothetical protein